MDAPPSPVLILVACVEPPDPEPPPEDDVRSIGELWTSPGFEGTVTTVSPLIVTSPRTADGTAFYASDPRGGPQSGVRIRIDPAIDDWPPPVGTRIQVTAWVTNAGLGPILEVGDRDDVRDLGIVGIPPVRPWVPDSGLDHSLVSVPLVRVTSRPDPLGRADLNGVPGLGGLFGVGPGWNRVGDLVGILDGGRVSPRGREDWSGELVGDPPVETDLADLADLPDGTPVTIDDLLLATPWSRDERWAVVQDATGVGRWVDALGWALPVVEGDVGRWTAEVRRDDAGVFLRAWDPPEVTGTRAPVFVTDPVDGALVDGALVEVDVSGIGPPDRWGERSTDGFVLDDRFVDLDGLPDPVTLRGAIRALPGLPWLAPLP